MKIVFSSDAWEDYLHRQGKDKNVLKKISELVRDILRDPDSPGLGKPERLKGDLAGYSSQRITAEHRLVYRVTDEQLIIIQIYYRLRKISFGRFCGKSRLELKGSPLGRLAFTDYLTPTLT